jgi:hypothetical protein
MVKAITTWSYHSYSWGWMQIHHVYAKAVSSNILYIHPLYPSFIVSSKRFYPLYLLPLQQRSLYSNIYIRDIFYFYFLYIRIYHTVKYIVHILVLLNRLFKVFKWIEDRLEKLYI